MKKRNLLTLTLSFMLIVAMLAACSPNKMGNEKTENEAQSKNTENKKNTEETKGGGVTITLYGNASDAAKPYMQRIFKLYEEESGNKLDIQGLDSNNFESVCLTKFRTGDIPDVLMHFGGYGLEAYNPSENFVDFTDAEWVSDIADTSVGQTMIKGRVYGLPFWESSVSGCFYNKKIFEEQNLDVPTTQAEFDAVCQKLLDAGIQPIYMPAGDAWPLLPQFGMDPIFLNEDNLNKLNANELTYAEIPEMRSMLEWYKSYADKGYFGKNFATDTWDYNSEVIGTGEAAMIFCWDTWFGTDYDNESYEYKKDDFGVFPMFMGTIDVGTYEGGNNSLLLVNKNSENVDVAIDFVTFCSKPENYNKAFEGIPTTPTFKGMTTNILSSQYKGAEESINKVGNPSTANNKIIGYSGEYSKYIQELMLGQIDVDECLKLMDETRIKIAKSQNVEGFK